MFVVLEEGARQERVEAELVEASPSGVVRYA
jgi:hypothetical protein